MDLGVLLQAEAFSPKPGTEGQHDVAANACFCTLIWARTAEPEITGGDHFASMFAKAPADAVKKITGAGLVAVLALGRRRNR